MARDIKAKIKLTADAKQANRELDTVTKSTGALSKGLKSLTAGLVAVGAAFAGVVAFVKSSIAAFNEQEKAVAKLDQVFRQLGETGAQTSLNLQAFASELQKVSNFGDEVTISAIAQIAAFTKNEEQIKALTQASADLAAGQGIDLASAAQLVARSFGTSTNALTRQGIEIEGVAGSTERLLELTQGVADLYGGQALAATNTLAGAQERLANALGDTAENVGQVIVEGTKLEQVTRLLAVAVENLNDASKDETSTLSQVASGFKDLALRLVPGVKALVDLDDEFELSEKLLTAVSKAFGINAVELAKQIKLEDDLAESIQEERFQRDLLTAALSATQLEYDKTTEAFRRLGVVLEEDVNAGLEKNERLLRAADARLAAGNIGRAEHARILRGLAIQNNELNSSLEDQADAFLSVDISREQYTSGVVRSRAQVDLLTEAEARNVEQFVRGEARRREATQFTENAISGGTSSFVTFSGGTFSQPPAVVGGANGTVSPIVIRPRSIFGVQ